LTADDDIPSHIPRRKGRSRALINASIEDYVWLGEDGELSVARMEQELFGPQAALQLILKPIIQAHSIDRKLSEAARLSAAMRALMGVKTPTRGPKKRPSDKELLEIIATEFLRDFYNLTEKRRAFKELVRFALRATTGIKDLDEDDVEKHRRRLAPRRLIVLSSGLSRAHTRAGALPTKARAM
jgi:hypothetical protein